MIKQPLEKCGSTGTANSDSAFFWVNDLTGNGIYLNKMTWRAAHSIRENDPIRNAFIREKWSGQRIRNAFYREKWSGQRIKKKKKTPTDCNVEWMIKLQCCAKKYDDALRSGEYIGILHNLNPDLCAAWINAMENVPNIERPGNLLAFSALKSVAALAFLHKIWSVLYFSIILWSTESFALLRSKSR